MVVDDLIGRYAEASERLNAAIASDDSDAIKREDHAVCAALDELMSIEPTDRETAVKLTEFLLSNLHGSIDQSELSRRTHSKVMSIVEHGYS